MQTDLITLDDEMYQQLKSMWQSKDDGDKALFKGIIVNQLNHKDLLTEYYAHLLVGVIHPSLTNQEHWIMKRFNLQMKLWSQGITPKTLSI
jgi:hypothetical protein